MKQDVIDINEIVIRNFIDELRPEEEEIRNELDFGYSFDGKAFELFEIRPIWGKASEKQKLSYAKIRFYKSRKLWNLYWMRASGKWELYEPFPEAGNIHSLITVIKEDKHGCFFG